MPDPFDKTQVRLNKTPLEDPNLLSGPFWGELRVFLAVAKAKSFNKAAEVLGMSQPTVSRHVKRLQDLMDAQLMVPTLSGIKLTDRGQELAQSLVALDQKLFTLSTTLRSESRGDQGTVRLSITEGLGAVFVAPNLLSFGDDYPRIQLHIRNPINLTSLGENQSDIMLGFVPATTADIACTPLGYLHFIPIATQNYIRRLGLPSLSNIEAGHQFVDSEYYAAATGLWAPWRDLTHRGTIAHFADSSFSYALMVRAGLGIGLLGTYALSDPTSVALDLNVHVKVPMYLLALNERLNSRPVRVVFEWLQSIFGETNPWFARDLDLKSLPRSVLWDSAAEKLLGDPLFPLNP
jgi:DNA-binding transcriptional LysR family regulator